MKVLIISDIHANYDGLKAVWEKEKDSDLILCLGDHVDWGFYPHEVITWFREHNTVCVAGNHDHETLNAYDKGVRLPTDGSPYTFQHYTTSRLTEEDVAWLRALPDERMLSIDGWQIFMRHYPSDNDDKGMHTVHASLLDFSTVAWCDKEWEILTGNAPSHFEKRLLLFGHTHQCQILQPGCGYMIVNPGSLAYRVCSDSIAKGADYIVMQDGCFTPHHIDYPVEHLSAMVDRENFVPEVNRPSHVYFGVQT